MRVPTAGISVWISKRRRTLLYPSRLLVALRKQLCVREYIYICMYIYLLGVKDKICFSFCYDINNCFFFFFFTNKYNSIKTTEITVSRFIKEKIHVYDTIFISFLFLPSSWIPMRGNERIVWFSSWKGTVRFRSYHRELLICIVVRNACTLYVSVISFFTLPLVSRQLRIVNVDRYTFSASSLS